MRFVVAVLQGCDVGLWAIMALHHPTFLIRSVLLGRDEPGPTLTKLSDTAAQWHSVAAYSNHVLQWRQAQLMSIDYMPTWG